LSSLGKREKKERVKEKENREKQERRHWADRRKESERGKPRGGLQEGEVKRKTE
jgi:hypothetical protein